MNNKEIINNFDIRDREWINNNSKVSKILKYLIDIENLLIDLDEYQIDNGQKYPEIEDMMLQIGEIRKDLTNLVDNNLELLNLK